MSRISPSPPPDANTLAADLLQALSQERVVQRFVDSYVVENGRHALQVHAPLYRDLLTLLQREALLAAAISLMDQVAAGPVTGKKPSPLARKDASLFRRKFLLAITREKKRNAGDALDFQNDLQVYHDVLPLNSGPRRAPIPFGSAHHPYVVPCALVLDAPFMAR